ncbi:MULTISPECIES: F0F1 ATP synthase subunit delta [Paraburkholderia]|uniref:F0F1 ATP synthase subunit B n=1 Tax=Paraburkholderia podalyriae TaxID=1938811 RepID=A0ABR7PXY3_9BURK|nr:F0F1 ATP synthase subunit delta [Paraburkholderia podalyriae]MBC8751128.1 F0F1 ATP synthase subunit B [Paraburkholderia podalyriae]
MRIDWSTLALQTINALVLIWLLARFLFRPVAQIIAERQKAAQALIGDADAAKQAAVRERDAAARETQQIVAARGDALKTIAAQAATEKAALLAAAQAEAAGLRAAAGAEAAAARAEQDKLVAVRATQLAVDIAAKLVAKLPESACVAGFIDGLADGLAQLPEAVRAQLGANGVTLALAAPRALRPEEQERCREVLANCLQRAVSVRFEVDPQLIAGLELRAPHAVVRNSFGGDLARIRAALLDGEHASG